MDEIIRIYREDCSRLVPMTTSTPSTPQSHFRGFSHLQLSSRGGGAYRKLGILEQYVSRIQERAFKNWQRLEEEKGV